jgi:hypothetical protein
MSSAAVTAPAAILRVFALSVGSTTMLLVVTFAFTCSKTRRDIA